MAKRRTHQQQPTIDMSTSFLSLPSELRNNIYEQLLAVGEIVPYGPFRPKGLTPTLLLTCKTIHDEASSVLYAQNVFDLTWTAESFLHRIGRKNASSILHIYISFPYFDYLELHNITLEDASSRMLAKIQNYCTSLTTLETEVVTTDDGEVRLDRLDNFKIVAEALDLVDARFRAIPAIRNIIVNVYEEGPFYIREEMKNHGWEIHMNKWKEDVDSDKAFSDDEYDFPDHGYYCGCALCDYNHDDRADEYDIDNDSDFWRRAAD
ncbi:hypothetical protein OCU04_004575 [Sclerotinia nivalis]|uniref:F-box domain-containing protein n=1 Tax=Sclerotinia nivalis TaxID=352851 RepID=A0A9X0AR37_9HELO|nr:hypothetical protein OCU04_004575 [Sclerotinia nivalis]